MRWLAGSMASVLLALGVASLVAAGVASGQPPTGSPALAQRVKPARAEVAQAAQLRAAILSVYFHTLAPGDAQVPPELRPMSLQDAARILRKDEGRFAESRRRRAVARLAAAGLDRPGTRESLEILGVSVREMEKAIGAPPTSVPEETAPRVYQYLADTYGPAVAGCNPGLAVTRVEPNPNSAATSCSHSDPNWIAGTTKVTFSVSVNRTLSVVAQILDPQNWDRCSEFFIDTYVAEQVDGVYPRDANHDAQRHPSPPAPATDWDAVLFEHFEMSLANVGSSWFRNLLEIESKREPTEYRVDYCLFEAVRSQVGVVAQNGGISVDEGYSRARVVVGAGVEVEGQKILKLTGWGFFDSWLNLWAAALLSAMGDAVADSLCCDVEEPGPPPPPVLLP